MGSRHPRSRIAPLALAALALACSSKSSAPSYKLHVPSPAWEEQVIYMVMTDRFANGDRRNDDQGKGEFDPADGDKYSGGDLQGIIDHLDYVQGLGATAIWITPPVANMWWDPLQQSGGYHGYWARHLEKVDEHLGTLDTYKALSSALHERGMYLVQDVVPNHMGNFFTYCDNASGLSCGPASYDPTDVTRNFLMNVNAVPTGKPEQAPFDQDDARDPTQRAAAIYHWTPAITDYTDPNQELNYQISDLDDLNSENPVTRQALRSSYGYWIREVGVDAFRVDTVKFVPHDFWVDFFGSTDAAAPGIHAVARSTGRDHFLAFGEVFEEPDPLDDAADRTVASYLGTPDAPELPSVQQVPLSTEIGRVLAGGSPTSYMTYRLGRLMDPTLFPDPYVLPTFVDNHDVQRFLSLGSDAALAQALAFMFTVPGIPVVYYGTEQSFTETRAAMFQGGFHSTADHFDTTAPSYQRIQALAALRKANKVFTHGDLAVLYDSEAGPGALAYRRTLGQDTALVLMNTADQAVLVSGLATGLPGGTVLQVLHSEQSPPAPSVDGSGNITMVLPARAVIVALATPQTQTPPAPGATITVATAIDGQTFTDDVTITGTVSPPSTVLQMVLDGYVDQATSVQVQPNGAWSVVLPVSLFPTGTAQHSLAFYAPPTPTANAAATPVMRFTTDVVFTGQTIAVTDPAGDDHGPTPQSAYTYPQDTTFQGKHYNDVTGVTLRVGATTMSVEVAMADWSTVWKPPLGFDHVAFTILFSVPGQNGATVLPNLNATTPQGFGWSYDQFTYGWKNVMYMPNASDPTNYGPTATAPSVTANAAAKTVTFVYDRTKYGLATWSGVQIWVTTWDYDGINNYFRKLTPDGGQWDYGGGSAIDPATNESPDPKIMDQVGPIAIP